MTRYHAVMIDETGCEFGASVEAKDKTEAAELLRENYPESRIAQLESPEDTAERERFMYQRLMERDEMERNGEFYWDD